MAEDGIIGFRFFENSRGQVIANEAAVKDRPGLGLDNEIAFAAAFDHLENARAAVGKAIEKKYGQVVDQEVLDQQDSVDAFHFTEIFDM